ncbi:MAG: hypothetical protein AseanaTS_28910 [Candidatus Pelagadaptatus aseana]|uniref:YhcB family protein n=1 Tax=Candidatus Pelagadaptatus aseana TaxID=3120508 RepID=UPI0039B31CC8
MFSLSALILTALVAVIAGALIGALLTKTLHPQQQQNRVTEKRLQETEDKLLSYQQEVSEHFAETSRLVNSLTQSYKDVYEHLADSALKLSNPDLSRQLIDAGDGKLSAPTRSATPAQAEEAVTEPPRDWAPKNPGDKGQLSEDFGMETPPEETAEIKIVS